MGTYRNPEEMSGKVLDLIRKYNVMELGQVELFFPGERTGVIRAMRRAGEEPADFPQFLYGAGLFQWVCVFCEG